MRIEFSWGTGGMEVVVERVIELWPMTNYRKWVKLFARYGTADQHQQFLQYVAQYITNAEATCAERAEELKEAQMRYDGRLPTVMSHSYWEGECKRKQSKLNGANSVLKRYKTIYSVLEGLVS